MKKILLLAFFLINSYALFATHILGGSMTYESIGNDEYAIQLEILRDCYGGQALFDPIAPITVFADTVFNTIDLYLVAQTPFTGIVDTLTNGIDVQCRYSACSLCGHPFFLRRFRHRCRRGFISLYTQYPYNRSIDSYSGSQSGCSTTLCTGNFWCWVFRIQYARRCLSIDHRCCHRRNECHSR